LFEGRGVEHKVNIVQGALQTLDIPNVPKKPAKSGIIIKLISHVVLLKFIPRKNGDTPYFFMG
jgi:hypothetical protein